MLIYFNYIHIYYDSYLVNNGGSASQTCNGRENTEEKRDDAKDDERCFEEIGIKCL